MTGKEVYTEVCSLCHGTIMSIGPKIGDKAAWASRIKQGDDVLVRHALQGYRQMPARGGKNSLTDSEVKNAVQYLVSHSQ
ncbi:MAG TPA: c-type cytochrome [Burkholderiales bacterium]|nr:c-type cytochrome [Burkholderiales bacterium]